MLLRQHAHVVIIAGEGPYGEADCPFPCDLGKVFEQPNPERRLAPACVEGLAEDGLEFLQEDRLSAQTVRRRNPTVTVQAAVEEVDGGMSGGGVPGLRGLTETG